MSNPTISCVIPAYNAERYLEESIRSVLNQTVRPIEVVVVDDGSADRTRQIAESFGAPVRYVVQDGRGPAAARNFGVTTSGGELVSFLDADDLWHAEKLERQLTCFEADPMLMICLTHVELMWDRALAAEQLHFANHPRGRIVPGFATISMLAQRAAFGRLGLLDPSLGMADAAEWLVRAREQGLSMCVMPDVLVYHRMHRSNLTRRKRQQSADEFLGMVKASLDRRRELKGTT
jgi:glycosyltransferase involved in cell wall biosynthesis